MIFTNNNSKKYKMEYTIKEQFLPQFESSFEKFIQKEVEKQFKTIDEINSPWNRSISFKELTYVFTNFFDNKEIISIGSGGGHFEYYFNENIRKMNNKYCNMFMTCVDPDPKSYCKEIKLFPLYENIQELIKLRSDKIIENCQIVIIWPSSKYTTYDIEAILTLKPKKIMILYEENGISGGEKLHKFINECKYLKENSKQQDYIEGEIYKYDIKYKVNTIIEKKFMTRMIMNNIDYYILKSFERI